MLGRVSASVGQHRQVWVTGGWHWVALGDAGRMSGKENDKEVDARKRAAASVSRSEKRQRMGEQAYLQEKRSKQQELKRRQKAERATAAAGALSQPAPPSVDIAGQLSKLAELWSRGALDDAEFKLAKAQVLTPTISDGPPSSTPLPSEHQPSEQPPNAAMVQGVSGMRCAPLRLA